MLQVPLKSVYLFFWYPEHKKVLKVINLPLYFLGTSDNSLQKEFALLHLVTKTIID